MDIRERTDPGDKFNLVYLIFLLHGIGVLLPWNMFITARSYFVDYKLNSSLSDSSSMASVISPTPMTTTTTTSFEWLSTLAPVTTTDSTLLLNYTKTVGPPVAALNDYQMESRPTYPMSFSMESTCLSKAEMVT